MSATIHPPLVAGASTAGNYALCSFQGKRALEVWNTKDLARLWEHLQNGNASFEWVMGFRDRATGAKEYKRSQKVPLQRGISWALASAQGKKTPERALAFVPFSTNAEQMSRWGGFDFDAHGGESERERARAFAFSAFRLLLNCESATILESSGSGGWHVWTIAPDFKPVAHWIRLLKGIARDIGATIEKGICEIFPPDTLSRGFGMGMRAPGTWNPSTNEFSEIWWQNADALIASLPPSVLSNSRRIGKVDGLYRERFPIEKKTSLSLLSFSERGPLVGGTGNFQIASPATRREKLKGLVATAFHQVSRTVAEFIARAQFREKTVATNASEAEHLQEFAELWEWLERPWLASLGATERECLAQLSTEAERGAFRIIRSYARKAVSDGNADFPIARDNLAARLDITGPGAGQLRAKFVTLGVIAQTAKYRPNVAAARYRWLFKASSSEA